MKEEPGIKLQKYTTMFFAILIVSGIIQGLSACGNILEINNSNKDKVHSGSYYSQVAPNEIPEVFLPGVLSSGLNEGACFFSPDGKELFFHISYYRGHDIKVNIVTAREENGKWSDPHLLSFSDNRYMDMYPFLSYDGSILYFSSDRPSGDTTAGPKMNFWTSRKVNDEWSRPELFKPGVEFSGETSGISFAENGNMYFTLNTEDGSAIYFSEFSDGKYLNPEKLPDEVNSGNSQFDGVIAPDESYMILCAYGRDDSFGSTDMYITFRNPGGNWSPLNNLGYFFNTLDVDGPAAISPDGKYIFFSSVNGESNWFDDSLQYRDIRDHFKDPGSGSSDIYWITSTIIEKFRPDGF